ncbi:MAG: hypothetical protein RIF32_07335 [Leptospirales bacterium]
MFALLAVVLADCSYGHPLVGVFPRPAADSGDPTLSLMVLLATPASASVATGRARPPDAFSGLKLWLEADQIAGTDGQPLSTWLDLSGQGNHATQSTPAQMPLYKGAGINSLPGVEFSPGLTPGTNLTLGANYLFSQNDGLTVFAVARSNAEDSTVSYLMDFGKNGQGGYGLIYSSNNDGVGNNITLYTPINVGGVFVSAATVSPVDAAAIVVGHVKFDPAADKNQTLHLNGTQVATSSALTLSQITSDEICRSPARGINNPLPLPNSATTCSGGAFSYGPVVIGGQSKRSAEAGRFFDGDIALIVWYDRVLNDDERQALECYASVKYSIGVAHSCSL